MHKKIALVTGGSKGIGLSVAKALLQLGYTTIIVARKEDELKNITGQINNDNLDYFVADLNDCDSIICIFKYIENKYGRIDLLFNNAGCNIPAKSIEEISLSEWQQVFNLNVAACFLCSKYAIELMKKQLPVGGRIINNGSISASTPRLYSAAYTASKHAISGLTKSISLDCRQFNIACGQINIGNASTDLANGVKTGVYQADGTIKTESMISVDDVANAIKMMVSLPLSTNVLDLTIIANTMPFVGRG